MKKIIRVVIVLIFIFSFPYAVIQLIVEKKNDSPFIFVSNNVIRVKNEQTGEILNVPFEDYIKGVLAGEMPVSFEIEALKAQAVAARSYVLKKVKDNYNNDYDVVNTVSNQVYLTDDELRKKWNENFDLYNNRLIDVVNSTKGQYMMYNGDIVEAFFFSTSSGKTENSGEVFMNQLPYLVSVNSKWDESLSPVFSNSYEFSTYDFCSILGVEYRDIIDIDVTETTSTGRVKKIKINDIEFSGNDVYKKLNLKSTFFEIRQVGSSIIITTKGYGHGVGMSQYGALGMAKEGYTYDEILKYYYKGIEIVNMN